MFDVIVAGIGAPYRFAVEACGRGVTRLGATPNAVTVAGLAVGIAASAIFIATHQVALFAMMIALGAFLDALDGEVARDTGMVTRVGSYLDATCDRIYEAAAIFAAGVVSGHWVMCFLFLAGSLCISYAKARAALEAPVRNDAWPDL